MDDREDSHEHSTIDTIDAIIKATSLIICILIAISLIWSSCDESMPQTESIVLKMTYCCIISYMISCLAVLISYTSNLTDFEYDTASCAITLSWDIAQLFIYISLMLRLHHSFNETKYGISKRIWIIFIVLIVLYGLCCILFTVHKIVEYQDEEEYDHSDSDIEIDLAGMYAVGIEIVDLTLSIFLIAIFIHKMIEVTVDLHSNEKEIFIDNQRGRINRRQSLLMDITAKHFILSFIATLWTQLTILFYCMFWFAKILRMDTMETIMYNIFIVFVGLDSMINPFCLYLIFKFNDSKYKKICIVCHLLARLCFTKCTKKRAERKYNNCNQADLSMELLK